MLLLERLERWFLTAVQAAQLARLLGREVEVPEWHDAKARLDYLLAAPPQRATTEWDSDEQVLMAATGLRR